MFDKIIIPTSRPATQYVPYEKTVTINKSSTAEDAKLLKEIEDEAINKLSNRVAEQIGDNQFELVRYDISTSPMDMTDKMRVIFKINGKVHSIVVEKSTYQRDIVDYIAKEFTRQIFSALQGRDVHNFFREIR